MSDGVVYGFKMCSSSNEPLGLGVSSVGLITRWELFRDLLRGTAGLELVGVTRVCV